MPEQEAVSRSDKLLIRSEGPYNPPDPHSCKNKLQAVFKVLYGFVFIDHAFTPVLLSCELAI